MPTEHIPVLAPELVALLDPQPGELVVDCTFGGGGHARLVADRIGPDGKLVCVDRDPAAAERFEAFAADAPCATRFVRDDYGNALDALLAEGLRADAVYMDLGISSLQLDAWERGFSYAYDAPLDMRMDPEQDLSALEVVNEWSERRLADAIRRYGEERNAGRIAREVIRRRPLATTSELAEAIRAALPPAARFGRGHPAKRTFQAIRITVNSELESLDRGLPSAWRLLRDGGRFAAISFHSLEDRRVKRYLADLARGCVCPPELPVCRCGRTPEAELVTRRAVSPSPEEIERNPRSSSAHLRVARKLREEDGTA
jgi:16S rRNA (cytosine1402-N4)-methyltransferase